MPESPPKRILGIAWTAWLACAIGAVAMAVSWIVIGVNLGLLFAGMLVALTLIAPLSLAETSLADRFITAGAIVDGIGTVWLVAALCSPITILQWLLCYAVLIAWATAIAGLTHLLDRLIRDPVPACVIVVLAGLIWLTSPIWLKMRAPSVVQVHPLMVVNGIVPQFGLWTERPIAYKYLFNLGQDVPYELPYNIVGFVLVHCGVGLVALLVSRLAGKS